VKQLLSLLEVYLSHQITTDDFACEFLDLWRELRDRHYQIIQENPDLKKAVDELLKQALNGTLSEDEYSRAYCALNRQYHNDEPMMLPGTFESKIIGDLFDAAENYYPDDLPGPNDLSDAEVLQTAQQAYERLKTITP
jgi:cell division septum initiation protein DivIVA